MEPHDPFAEAKRVEFLSRVRPKGFAGLSLVRVGESPDGGYVMADLTKDLPAVSVGVGSDVSWDTAMLRRGSPVYMFDPTIRRPPSVLPGSRFFRIGVGAKGRRYRPLTDLINNVAGLDGRQIVLKMDVEGAEWNALDVFPLEVQERCVQIILELHDVHRIRESEQGELIMRVIRKLTTTHVPVYIHANNYAPIRPVGSGWIPSAVELSLVLKAHLPRTNETDWARDPNLETPCHPGHPDIDISWLENGR